jgi:tRNA threonylcarbamoyladenosine biosynthesis protein TsaE
MIIHLQGLSQTEAFAKRFIKQVAPGTIIALEGDLGAGKTTFVKYCAQALGIREIVDSPTFTLLKTYGSPSLHHIDAYRLEGGHYAGDIEDALDDQKAYIFVEWASYISDALPTPMIELHFKHINENEREVTVIQEGLLNVEKLLND